MSLEKEVSKGRQVIHTDAYPMSIGEIINIYRDNEIDIHPEFQRQYRWKSYQKSRLIESILLGIPLPSIFVAQRVDGVWDVVDGLQRLSTILSFAGELINDEGKHEDPLVLEKTRYLPSLQGVSWSGENGSTALPDELKRAFKREKIDVKIIKKESDENAKFELFQRLNTGGSDLSEQEVRNCLLIMLKRPAYTWLKKMSDNVLFLESLDLSDRLVEEKYQMELVLRFVISAKFDSANSIDYSDMGPYITSQMKTLLVDSSFDFDAEEALFERTFKIVHSLLCADAFKRYSASKSKHEGQFSVSLFEFVTSGVAYAILSDQPDSTIESKLSKLVKQIGDDPEFTSATRHGVRGISRFPKLVELSRKFFN